MAKNDQNGSRGYDLTYLEELSAGDPLFIKNIVQQFITDAPLVIQKIQTDLLDQNWPDLSYQIHKFATNLAFLGMNDIKDELNLLEKYSKNQTDLTSIPGLVDMLIKRCELGIECLKKDFKL